MIPSASPHHHPGSRLDLYPKGRHRMEWFSRARLLFWVNKLFNSLVMWLALIVCFILLLAFLTRSAAVSVVLGLVLATAGAAVTLVFAYRRQRPVLLYFPAKNHAAAKQILAAVKQAMRWDMYFVEVFDRDGEDCLLRPKLRRANDQKYKPWDVKALVDGDKVDGFEVIVACPARLRASITEAVKTRRPTKATSARPATAS